MSKVSDPVGPLQKARHNLEEFADSLIRQHMLRAVVDAYLVGKLLEKADYQSAESMAEIESVWSAMADDFAAKGVSS